MKWPWLLFVGWLAIFPRYLRADDHDAPDPISRTSLPSYSPNGPSLPGPSLLRQNASARFYLVLGRLQLDPVRYRKGSQTLLHASVRPATSSSQPPGSPLRESTSDGSSDEMLSETLQVNSQRGLPSMHYSMTNQPCRVTVEGDALGRWRMDVSRIGEGPVDRVIVEQHPDRPITLPCHFAGSTTSLNAQTWFHLREADRALFATYLEPILDEMIFPYSFQRLADEVTEQSLRSSCDAIVENDQVMSWIEELRSPSRITRLNADRNLRSLGISLLPKLARLDRSALDSEQRQRLAHIEAKLTPATEDDPARLAKLMRDDYEYWELVSTRLDNVQHQLIATRFKQLGGKQPVLPGAESLRIATGSAAGSVKGSVTSDATQIR